MPWTPAAIETLKRVAGQVAPLTFIDLTYRAEAIARDDFLARRNPERVVNADHLRRAHRELRGQARAK